MQSNSQFNEANQFRHFVEAVRDYAIFLLDSRGNVATWNAGAEQIKGYSADEIVGKHFSAFYAVEDRERDWPGHLLRLAVSQGRCEDEGWRLRKDGSTFWANVVITAIHDKAGQLTGFIKVTRDLSERKRSDAALAASRNELMRTNEDLRQYRHFVEAVQDYAIFLLDPDGNVTSWNAGAQQIKGYVAAEIIGGHFSTFYTTEDLGRGWPAQLLRRAASQGRCEDEGWRVRKGGSTFWASVAITAIRDEAGLLTGFTKVTRDLSERKKAESALLTSHNDLVRVNEDLRLSEGRFRAIIDSMSVLVWSTDITGGSHRSTPPWHEYTGLPEETVRGDGWVMAVHPDDREQAAARFRESLTTGQPLESEFRVRRADGQIRYLTARGIPLRDEKGDIQEWTGVCLDITDRKRAEFLNAAVTDNVRDSIVGLDDRGQVESINLAAKKAFGYPESEVVGHSLKKLIPQSYHQYFAGRFRRPT